MKLLDQSYADLLDEGGGILLDGLDVGSQPVASGTGGGGGWEKVKRAFLPVFRRRRRWVMTPAGLALVEETEEQWRQRMDEETLLVEMA